MTKQKSDKIYVVKRDYNEEFLIALTEIKKDTTQIFIRLEKINGTISDYPITKERLSNACVKIEELDTAITKNLVPAITNIKIKVWSVAGIVGSVSAGLGGLVGILIGKMVGG